MEAVSCKKREKTLFTAKKPKNKVNVLYFYNLHPVDDGLELKPNIHSFFFGLHLLPECGPPSFLPLLRVLPLMQTFAVIGSARRLSAFLSVYVDN